MPRPPRARRCRTSATAASGPIRTCETGGVRATAERTPRDLSRGTERTVLRAAQRVVVKIGSSSLTRGGGALDPAAVAAVADALAARREAGTQVVLVSSGAIA
ncbi:MAG: hypothetical protein J0H73_10590, partial [Salana multivorans]|nr:hypothetical protein [Salana multivorans]